MKKIITSLLALICLTLMFSGCGTPEKPNNSGDSPSPVKDFEFEAGEDGLTVTKYLGSAKKIVIPSIVDNKKVVGFKREVFGGNIVVEEIVLSEYMTEVHLHYFNGCDNLKTLTLSLKGDEPYYCGSGYSSKNPKNLTTIVFSQLKTIDVSVIESIRDSAPNVSTFIYKSADSIKSIPISRKESGGYNIIIPNKLLQSLESKTIHLYNCEKYGESQLRWILDGDPLEIDFEQYHLKQINKPGEELLNYLHAAFDSIVKEYQNNGNTIISTTYYSCEGVSGVYYLGFVYKNAKGNLNYYIAPANIFDPIIIEEYKYNYVESKTDPNLAVTTAFGRVDSITVNGTTYSYDHE